MRPLASVACFAAVLGLSACNDMPDVTSPADAEAQTITTDLGSMDVRELLIAVLGRLDSIETRLERRATEVGARLDSLRLLETLIGENTHTLAAGGGSRISQQICVSLAAEGGGEGEVALKGRAEAFASLGLTALGSGAEGRGKVFGDAAGKLVTGAKVELGYEFCVALGPNPAAPAPSSPGGPAGAPPGGSDLSTQVLAAAQQMGVSPENASAALDFLSSPPALDFSQPYGGAQTLINALPLPNNASRFLDDPRGTIQSAVGVGLTGIGERLCGGGGLIGSLFESELSEICGLVDGVPSPSEVVDIISQLDGLPTTIGALQDDIDAVGTRLTSACSKVRSELVGHSVTIPETDITKGLAVVGTFPRTTVSPFSSLPTFC